MASQPVHTVPLTVAMQHNTLVYLRSKANRKPRVTATLKAKKP